MKRVSSIFVLVVLFLFAGFQAPGQEPAAGSVDLPSLIRLLVQRGVLQPDDARQLAEAATPVLGMQLLVAKLVAKGVISNSDLQSATAGPKSEPVLLATAAPSSLALPLAATLQAPKTSPQQAAAPARPAGPTIVPAIAPLRVLPVEPVKQGGIIPDIKLGSGAYLKPYGLLKAGFVYDSSSPSGTDMPLPYLNGDTGPTLDPEYHIKARYARLGTQIEWPDVSPKLAITGKVEADFEGDFTRVLNRNISTIRSSMFSLRLAYGRLDYTVSPRTTLYAVFGQDWTPFGSSTLPTIVETTGLGLGFGTLYERAPQARFGVTKALGSSPRNFKFTAEAAAVLSAFGNDPSNVADQLGYGERQGADSARPDVQGRMVLQWQLDRAPGVAPAQLIVSGIQGRREALVVASAVPAAYKAFFPNGAEVGNDRYGYSVEAQIPTRYITLLGKYYNGKDLRFYFVGELYSNFNDTYGLTNTASAPSIDGASTVFFGTKNGVPVVANQLGVRTSGFLVNASLPLSRIFHANPSGRNAGWATYFDYNIDRVPNRDAIRLAGVRAKSDMAVWTTQYKLNSLVSFFLEESMYRTRSADGTYFILRGIPARQWHDIRSEFATQFTF